MSTTKTFTRSLGRSGIQISAMGLGCWAVGGDGWGDVDDNETIKAIRVGLDMGVNFLDTADVYGMGHSERQVAKAIEGRRDQIVIATKFGNEFNEETKTWIRSNAEPDFIRQACEYSLRRLNTDYIDLYQFHWNGFPAEDADPVRETLEELVKAGKIRTYGWSTDFPDRARVFAAGENCSAIQVELNVIDDAADIIEVCEEFNLAAINRGPLAMGILTGKYKPGMELPEDDVRGPNAPDWMKYFKDGQPNPEWLSKMEAVREILTSKGRTLAQGALAWLWGRSETTIPIPGFKTVKQVKENVSAMELGPLTTEQMEEIETILDR